MQIKITRCYHTPTRMAKFKRSTGFDRTMEKLELTYVLGGDIK